MKNYWKIKNSEISFNYVEFDGLKIILYCWINETRKNKGKRFEILQKIAKYKLKILDNSERIKLLGDMSDNEEKI